MQSKIGFLTRLLNINSSKIKAIHFSSGMNETYKNPNFDHFSFGG